MGPADISDMTSTSTTNQGLTIPKLKPDGSNWTTYSERVMNYLTSKGLKRHVLGTARKPVDLEERGGKHYKPDSLTPLKDDEIEKHETEQDEYEQKQASVREVIYRTIDNSTFLQVKSEKDAAAVWKKVVSIHADKGSMYETNLLTQLQNTRYIEGESMREHLAKMIEIKERLAEMSCQISDESFVSYIRTSLSLVQNFRSLISTLTAAAHESGKKLTSTNLIWHLNEEANSIALEDSINKSNEAMVAAVAKAQGGKGKLKAKGSKDGEKSGKRCANPNCKRKGHMQDQCYEKGGGKEAEAPDWWKEKKKQSAKGKSANAAVEKSDDNSNDSDNHAMLTYRLPDNSSTLQCTSNFKHEAHAVYTYNGIILDCGASSHFTPDKNKLINYQKIEAEPIRAADGHIFSALGKGDMKIELPNGNQKPTPVTLKNVFYSPHLAFTLMSVGRMDQNGYEILIKDSKCVIRSPKSNIIGQIPLVRGLYRVSQTSKLSSSPVANTTSKPMTISELHRKMGHVNHEDLRKMVKDGMITGIDLDMNSKPEFCEPYIKAKATRKHFPKKSDTKYENYGDKIVADTWGPAPVESLGRNKYHQIFQDLSSHEERVYFSRQKSAGFDNYKKYEAWVKNQRGATIKIFGTDRGGEFTSKAFNNHIENAGTVRHLTVHDSPSSNGAAERANRTHMECALAMIVASGLPKNLWGEAVLHSIWIRNRTPTRAIEGNQTPYEKGTGKKPDLTKLIEWGATAWVKKLKVGKLDPKVEKERFVGFDDELKGFRIYWPEKKKVSVERDVYFNKDEALQPDEVQIEGEWDLPANSDINQSSDTQQTPENDQEPSKVKSTTSNDTIQPRIPEIADKNLQKSPTINPQTSNTSQNDDIPPLHPKTRRNSLQGLHQYDSSEYGHGKRVRKPTTSHADVLVAENGQGAFVLEENGSLEPGGVEIDVNEAEWFREELEVAMVANCEDEPSLKEALGGCERADWIEAIEAELTQIEKLNTWELVETPPGTNVIPCRCVFRRKRDADGNITRYKARLVAKGYKQEFGVDYHETFAPTVRPATLRILLSLGAQKNASIHQIDVKNAYLNSKLKEDEIIHMQLPPLYHEFRELPPKLRKAKSVSARLYKPLYGTKQGAHKWYHEVVQALTELGYTVSIADEAVFYKLEEDKFMIVAAATDDFTLIADSDESIELLKQQLRKRWEITDLGAINWLLGVKISRNLEDRTISLCQQTYIEQILARFGLEDSRTAVTPLEPGIDLTPDSPAVSSTLLTPYEKTKYREMIGSLMYVTVMTRPDISFAVSTLSQYLENPHTTHLKAVTRVFRYLSGTKDLKLVLGGSHSEISGYSDADWASHVHRHSISGFVYFIGAGIVSWSCKKQPIITLSSTEAEYVALTHSSKDILWIHKLLSEFSRIFSFHMPTTLLCDNQGAIRLSKDSTFHARTKHIDVHFHFIRQTISSGHIVLKYCPTSDMVADIFTKSLAHNKFEKFRDLLGLK